MKRAASVLLCVPLLTACAEGESSSQGSSEAAGTSQTTTTIINVLPGSEEDGTYNGVTYLFQDGTPVLSFDRRYRQICDTYPDKTVLVWALDTDVRFESELNEYLASQGKDYVICFDNILFGTDLFGVSGEPVSYTVKLDQDIAAGAEYDIIGSGGVCMNIDGFSGTYRRCADKGYFIPLDSYLSDTEAGRKLYDLMPERYWDTLRTGGSIYGFDGELTSLKFETGFKLNSSLMEREGIDAGSFTGSYYDITSQLVECCKGADMMLQFNQLYSLVQESVPGESVTQCVYIEDGKAKNIFESEEAVRLFDKVCEGYVSGNVYPLNAAADFTRLLAATRSYHGGGFIFEGEVTSKENGIQGQMPALLRFPDTTPDVSFTDTATGIYFGSEHKDMAFDALATVMSDPELNDLLCFGPDRKYADGAVAVTPENSFNTLGIQNLLLRSPRSDENIASHEKLRDAYEQTDTVAASAELDLSSVERQISATNMTVINIPVFFPEDNYKTGSEYLEELNRQLYSQGLQDIIDEINLQLEAKQ